MALTARPGTLRQGREATSPPQAPSPTRPWHRQVGQVAHCHGEQVRGTRKQRRSLPLPRHFSFSFRLLLLWLLSSSSFLSSLLWSCALLAGSRDRSLVPLPAYRTPSRLILCRAWARALSPQPWIWGGQAGSLSRVGTKAPLPPHEAPEGSLLFRHRTPQCRLGGPREHPHPASSPALGSAALASDRTSLCVGG